MSPGDLVNPGIGLDVALEVNVDTLTDRAQVQIAAKLQGNHRLIWKFNQHHITRVHVHTGCSTRSTWADNFEAIGDIKECFG